MSETLDVPATDSVTSQQGIWAEVTIDVTLESYAKQRDRVVGIVTISAVNNTKNPIRVSEMYSLPARNAYTSKAVVGGRDQLGMETADKLATIETKKAVEVYFGDGERGISPGETFTWT